MEDNTFPPYAFDHDMPENAQNAFDYQQHPSNISPNFPYRPGPLDFSRQEQQPAQGSEAERLMAVRRAIATLYQEAPGFVGVSLTLPQAMSAALGLPAYPDAATNDKAYTPERMRTLLIEFDKAFPHEAGKEPPFGITLSWTSWGEIIVSVTSPLDPANWMPLLRAFGDCGVEVDYGGDSIDTIRFFWPRPIPDLQ